MHRPTRPRLAHPRLRPPRTMSRKLQRISQAAPAAKCRRVNGASTSAATGSARPQIKMRRRSRTKYRSSRRRAGPPPAHSAWPARRFLRHHCLKLRHGRIVARHRRIDIRIFQPCRRTRIQNSSSSAAITSARNPPTSLNTLGPSHEPAAGAQNLSRRLPPFQVAQPVVDACLRDESRGHVRTPRPHRAVLKASWRLVPSSLPPARSRHPQTAQTAYPAHAPSRRRSPHCAPRAALNGCDGSSATTRQPTDRAYSALPSVESESTYTTSFASRSAARRDGFRRSPSLRPIATIATSLGPGFIDPHFKWPPAKPICRKGCIPKPIA